MTIKIEPIKIFFSTEALQPLINFINIMGKSKKSTASRESYSDDVSSVNDYYLLMQCVNYSKEESIKNLSLDK